MLHANSTIGAYPYRANWQKQTIIRARKPRGNGSGKRI